MAKDCLILSASGVDLRAAGALADVAVTRGSNAAVAPYFKFCKALAEFRLGHYEEAAAWARLATEGPFRYPKVGAAAVTAMSKFKLNQLADPQAALSECNKIIKEQVPKPEQDLGSEWRDWIIAQALRDEAEKLLVANQHVIHAEK
jgi:hypothetical protein